MRFVWEVGEEGANSGAVWRAVSERLGELPEDPVEFCRGWLGYEPFEYMEPFLRDPAHFVANVQARQTGKTFNGMAKLLWLAFRYPGSLIARARNSPSAPTWSPTTDASPQTGPSAPRSWRPSGSSW